MKNRYKQQKLDTKDTLKQTWSAEKQWTSNVTVLFKHTPSGKTFNMAPSANHGTESTTSEYKLKLKVVRLNR